MHRLDQILYYLRESPMLAAGLCMILLVVLFGVLGSILRRYLAGPAAGHAAATSALAGASLWHRRLRSRPARRDGGRGAPDHEDRSVGWHSGARAGHFSRLYERLYGRQDRHGHPRPRGYAADRARSRGAGLHCLDDPRGNQRQHHGPWWWLRWRGCGPRARSARRF